MLIKQIHINVRYGNKYLGKVKIYFLREYNNYFIIP